MASPVESGILKRLAFALSFHVLQDYYWPWAAAGDALRLGLSGHIDECIVGRKFSQVEITYVAPFQLGGPIDSRLTSGSRSLEERAIWGEKRIRRVVVAVNDRADTAAR